MSYLNDSFCSCGNKCSAEQRLLAAIFGEFSPKCVECSEREELERTLIKVNGVPLEEYLEQFNNEL